MINLKHNTFVLLFEKKRVMNNFPYWGILMTDWDGLQAFPLYWIKTAICYEHHMNIMCFKLTPSGERKNNINNWLWAIIIFFVCILDICMIWFVLCIGFARKCFFLRIIKTLFCHFNVICFIGLFFDLWKISQKIN